MLKELTEVANHRGFVIMRINKLRPSFRIYNPHTCRYVRDNKGVVRTASTFSAKEYIDTVLTQENANV